jgi:DnaJ-class molecular chaperone
MFVETYTRAVNSSNLKDDELHHMTDVLAASALADASGSNAVMGSLLCRVKFADGMIHQLFESGTGNLATLLRIWTNVVTEKGRSRGWVPANTAWDMQAAMTLYKRVAEASLAHWMDGTCEPCQGTGIVSRRTCTCCAGSGRAHVEAGRFETDIILNLVSELEGLFQAHGGRASAKLRRFT